MFQGRNEGRRKKVMGGRKEGWREKGRGNG